MFSGVLNQEDIGRYISFYLHGDASCIETKTLNQHLTQKVQNEYRSAVNELGIQAYMKSLEDKIKNLKSAKQYGTDNVGEEKHKKCAKNYERGLLNYQNNILFTPPEKLKLLNKTHFNIYSCEVDLLRDDTYVMVAMLQSLNISHTHIHTGNCYHGSFNDNTSAGTTLRGKVVKSINSL